MLAAGVHQADLLPRPEDALAHPDQHDDAAVRVVLGVEDQRLERRRPVALGRRQPLHDRVEHVPDALARLGGAQHRLERVEAQVALDLLAHPVHVGGGQVDLVDHRDDRQVVLQRQVEVGHRLRLDALGRVDQQQRPLAGHERPPHLVREVDVARRVDQVQAARPALRVLVAEGHGVALDRDAPLPLDVHRVEDLVAELPVLDRPAVLDQAVGERRLAVVDVGDDAEVADGHGRAASYSADAVAGIRHGLLRRSGRRPGQEVGSSTRSRSC